MHFDLFYELSVPGFVDRSERQVYEETLQELELAEELGFSTAWLVEHHFMPEYSHSTSPELFLAAASQRTQRLRLGHAIIPLPYNHPVRVAERLATLDVLSNGRLEFGFGRGFSPKEYGSFGVDMGDSRTVTQESLEIIQRSFENKPVSYHGKHFTLEEVDILPKVIQQPHPPVWTAAVSPDSFELAAQLGIGALVGPFKPWFMIKEDIKHYRKAWKKYHGDTVKPGQNPKIGMTLGIFCLEDGKEARNLAREGIEWFYRKLLGQTKPILEQLYDSYEYYRKMGRFSGGLLDKAVNLTLLETLGMVIVGDPEHCEKKLRTLEKAGVDHTLLAVGAGVLPTEQVQRSMRILSEQVFSKFPSTVS